LNGPVLGCPVSAEIDHLNTRQVSYSDGYCIPFTFAHNGCTMAWDLQRKNDTVRLSRIIAQIC
jgi:hypothetical protein